MSPEQSEGIPLFIHQADLPGAEYVSDNIDSITAAGSELGETVSHTASGIAVSVKVAAGDLKKISTDKIDAAADKASDIKKAASSTITNLFNKD